MPIASWYRRRTDRGLAEASPRKGDLGPDKRVKARNRPRTLAVDNPRAQHEAVGNQGDHIRGELTPDGRRVKRKALTSLTPSERAHELRDALHQRQRDCRKIAGEQVAEVQTSLWAHRLVRVEEAEPRRKGRGTFASAPDHDVTGGSHLRELSRRFAKQALSAGMHPSRGAGPTRNDRTSRSRPALPSIGPTRRLSPCGRNRAGSAADLRQRRGPGASR